MLLSFLVRYNNKTYRIDDIDWECNPQATFKLHSGEDITFIEYYKRVSEGMKWKILCVQLYDWKTILSVQLAVDSCTCKCMF